MSGLRISINGAAGRMGQRLIALASQDDALQLSSAIEWSEHPQFGNDAGEIAGVGNLDLPLCNEIAEGTQAVIDFSVPAGAETIVNRCSEQQIPLVMATTGLSDSQQQLVRDASNTIPIVWAPSMSMAVNLTMKLSTIAGEILKNTLGGADVEILERHHRFKEDAPSGTALRFGNLIAEAMDINNHVHGREGQTGARTNDEIGYHAIRTGDNPGEHTIVFGMLGETIELTVRASNRDCYALGALQAAKFVATRSPGLYGMNDVLGL